MVVINKSCFSVPYAQCLTLLFPLDVYRLKPIQFHQVHYFSPIYIPLENSLVKKKFASQRGLLGVWGLFSSFLLAEHLPLLHFRAEGGRFELVAVALLLGEAVGAPCCLKFFWMHHIPQQSRHVASAPPSLGKSLRDTKPGKRLRETNFR